MPLFQSAVLNKYLKQQDSARVAAAYTAFTAYFQNAERQANILNAKEEQFQETFLRALFVDVLGYALNPDPGYNLTSEFKNEKGSKKADGAILVNGKALAVIELKGTDTTDLATINTQAFGYKANHTECVYVITSNYQKLRFFIDNAVEWLEFDLFTLNAEQFQLLWLCLQRDNLLGGIPKKVKAESVQVEEQVTKRLYKDYSAFKTALWQDLCANHPDQDKLHLYKKSQKLLDRFLFVLFSEDKGLLPPNTLRGILTDWKKLIELDEHRPLYERCQKYFGYLNTGFKSANQDIFAYNGGLFKPDELLDTVRISDAVLEEHLGTLTKYDFASEVDVNILGHIFEHSLNEIEAITAQIEGRALDTKKTKRKKDGVFYTPKYITKYIVENTVGRLCTEKKEELAIVDEEYAKGRKGRQKKTIQELDTKLEVYRDWLLSLTICDPACGSGAFLNQALDFLIAEHQYVNELESKLLGQSIVFKDIGDHILERNIYGVDINEESVEIARLSLWLRTATKGRKLNDLSGNIKCGNSLIDDPAVAGAKAFDWANEFPAVFAKGGFDVVIGNPPYGVIGSKEQKPYFKQAYSSFQGHLENYCFFIELFMRVARKNTGCVGLIVPTTWTSIPQFENLRRLVLAFEVIGIIELPTKVFTDADLDTLILLVRKSVPDKVHGVSVVRVSQPNTTSFEQAVVAAAVVPQAHWSGQESPVISLDGKTDAYDLSTSIRKKTQPLKSVYQVSQGIVPYAREEFYRRMGREAADRIVDEKHWHAEKQIDPSFKKELRGEDVTQYRVSWNGVQWVKYGEWLARPRTPDFFTRGRVLLREITRGTRLNAAYTDEELYNNPGVINIICYREKHSEQLLKCLVAVLNSHLAYSYHLANSPKAQLKTSIPKILIKDVEEFPLPNASELLKSGLHLKTEAQTAKHQEIFNLQEQLCSLLKSKYTLPTLSRALENWPGLEFKGFLAELKKAKVSLTLAEEAEWLTYFTAEKAKAQALQAQIAKTDKEIDALVYQLYGLTEEEVKVVEGK